MFFINTNYKNIGNKTEIIENVALITVLKKTGEELITKIDAADLERVTAMGTWFAEWNKNFNNYIIQNISTDKTNKKAKPLKQSLQSVILDVNPKAPIRHINGDTLDNRRVNLEIVERNKKNDYIQIDSETIAVILRDKYGKEQGKALISKDDFHIVVREMYSWVLYKNNGDICVIANTPEGRIHLDRVIMTPGDGETVHHINLNPLDNRRENLENVKI